MPSIWTGCGGAFVTAKRSTALAQRPTKTIGRHRGIAMNPPDPIMKSDSSSADELGGRRRRIPSGPTVRRPTTSLARAGSWRRRWLPACWRESWPGRSASGCTGRSCRHPSHERWRVKRSEESVSRTKLRLTRRMRPWHSRRLAVFWAWSWGRLEGSFGSQSWASVEGAVTGLVLGCGLTAGATWGLLPVYFRALERSQEAMSHDLLLPLLIHCRHLGGRWTGGRDRIGDRAGREVVSGFQRRCSAV